MGSGTHPRDGGGAAGAGAGAPLGAPTRAHESDSQPSTGEEGDATSGGASKQPDPRLHEVLDGKRGTEERSGGRGSYFRAIGPWGPTGACRTGGAPIRALMAL